MNITASVDGHYWIVRNGEIIDPTPIDYDSIACQRFMFYKKATKKLFYLPADEIVQKVMTLRNKKYDKIIQEIYEEHFKEENIPYPDTDNIYKWIYENGGKLQDRWCYENCRSVEKEGDKLIFGSVGFRLKNGGVHYFYGGENYTVADFFKP